MKIHKQQLKASLWIGLLFSFFNVFGQEDEDTIGVQEVTVIKSYTPSLSEVFKIREQPLVIDSIGREKRKMNYSIFSIPVASTFIPSKGSAKVLQKKKSTPKYSATVSSGFGNFNNFILDHSAQINLDRRQQVSWLVHFNGLFKDMPEPILSTKQSAALVHLSYSNSTNSMTSLSQLSFRSHSQNFYGLNEPIEDEVILSNLNPKQRINYLSIKSDWQWYSSLLKEASITAHLTTDSFSTNELQLKLKSKFQVSLGSIAINLDPSISYLNNKFASEYYSNETSSFASGISKINLFVSSGANRFKFKAGAAAVYGFGDDFIEKSLFLFPLLDLSYKPKKGNLTPFLKVSGDFNQNSFRSFSDENPFVAPAIILKNTEVPYAVELGTRTKLVSGWEFTMNAYYQKANNAPFFRSFGYDNSNEQFIAFRYGNSFEVIYGELEQFGFDTSVLAAFKNGGSLSLQAHWRDYSAEETEAWNMPELQFDFKANIKIFNKIFIQPNIIFIGARKNSYRERFLVQNPQDAPFMEADLPSFVNAEVKVTYQLTDRWEFYVKGENIFNAPEFRWANYQAYGARFLSGVRYNFDL